MTATIASAERFDVAQLLTHPGRPTLVVNERAALPCGCSCWIGIRIDTCEPATAVIACDPDLHLTLMQHFNLLLRESLVEPTSRPLVDIAVELLAEAVLYQEADRAA